MTKENNPTDPKQIEKNHTITKDSQTGGHDTTMHNNLYQTSNGVDSKTTHSKPDSDVAMNAGEARKSHMEHAAEAKSEAESKTLVTDHKE